MVFNAKIYYPKGYNIVYRSSAMPLSLFSNRVSKAMQIECRTLLCLTL